MIWTLPAPLAAQALARAHHVALVCEGQQLTYKALADKARAQAQALAAQGFAPGMTMALFGPQNLAYLVQLHALWWLGLSVLPVSPHLSAQEVERLVGLAQPDGLLVPHPSWSPQMTQIEDQGLKTMVWTDATAPTDAYQKVVPHDFALDDVVLKIASSGTTQQAKVVSLKTGQLVFSAWGVASRLGHLPSDSWLLSLPCHHVGGLSIVWRALMMGTTVELVLPFDADAVAKKLGDGSVTLAALVPTMLARVLAVWPQGQKAATALRAVVLGGASTPPALAARGRDVGLPLALSWGMTETASQVATQWPDTQHHGDDVGPALLYGRVSSHQGALQVTGPITGQPTPLSTQDCGHIDDDGLIQVTGRIDDIIISGGENIVPSEIEAVLTVHPAVADAAVGACPDPVWGARVVAYLVLKDGRDKPDDGELAGLCRARLASFKVPREFIWESALPRDALGKLRRRALGHSGCSDVGPHRST